MAYISKVCSVCKKPKPTEYKLNSPYCQDCHDRNWGYETELHMRTMYPEQYPVQHYQQQNTMCYICLQIFEFDDREINTMRRKLCVDCYKMITSRNVNKKK